MAEHSSERWQACFKSAAWAVLLGPLGVILHELGHLLVARALGDTHSQLTYAAVQGTNGLSGSEHGWMALGGIGVTLSLTLIGTVLFLRDTRSYWPLVLAMTAPSRFFVGPVYAGWWVLLKVRGGSLGSPGFDEAVASRGLNISLAPLLFIGTLALVLATTWLPAQAPVGERRYRWFGTLAGFGAGVALWGAFFGPLILPVDA